MTSLLTWNWITNEFPSPQTKSDAEWTLENSTIYASGVEPIVISLWTALQPRNLATRVIANPVLVPPRPLLSLNEPSTMLLTRPMALLHPSQQMPTSGSDLGALSGRDFVDAPNSAFSF